LPPGAASVALAVMLSLFACFLLRVGGGAKISGIVAGLIVLEFSSDPWNFALARLIETLLGVVAAIVVSFVPMLIPVEAKQAEEKPTRSVAERGAQRPARHEDHDERAHRPEGGAGLVVRLRRDTPRNAAGAKPRSRRAATRASHSGGPARTNRKPATRKNGTFLEVVLHDAAHALDPFVGLELGRSGAGLNAVLRRSSGAR
jgi:hypothetical protein